MKKLFLAISLLVLSNSLFAQLKQGEFAVGGSKSDRAYSIVETMYNEYILYGSTCSFMSNSYNIAPYLVMFDDSGNVKWAKYFLGCDTASPMNTGAGMILATNIDQQYILVVGTDYNGCFVSQFVFVKCLDLNGNVIWSTNIAYGIPMLTSLTHVKDGNLILTGRELSGGVDIEKLSINGNLLWGGAIYDTINNSSAPWGNSIVSTSDGGFSITGGVDTSYMRNILFIKFDSTAKKIMSAQVFAVEKHYFSVGNSIIQTSDKGFAVVGSTIDSTNNVDMFMLKLDSLYNAQWVKTIGGNGTDSAFSVIQTSDKGYAIVGTTNSFGAGGYDVYIVKLDSSGSLTWDKTIGGVYDDGGYSIIQTENNGYAIGGYTKSFGIGHNDDMYFVKLDSNGNGCSAKSASGIVVSTSVYANRISLSYNLGATSNSSSFFKDADTETVICNVTAVDNIKPNSNSVSCYPNPNTGKFAIDVKGNDEKRKIDIYNIMGEKVYNETLQQAQGDNQIDISNQPSGIYLYRVIAANGSLVGSGKLMIER